jgi:hypothetical protein
MLVPRRYIIRTEGDKKLKRTLVDVYIGDRYIETWQEQPENIIGRISGEIGSGLVVTKALPELKEKLGKRVDDATKEEPTEIGEVEIIKGLQQRGNLKQAKKRL